MFFVCEQRGRNDDRIAFGVVGVCVGRARANDSTINNNNIDDNGNDKQCNHSNIDVGANRHTDRRRLCRVSA
jgi:hypothetical protein